MGGCAQSYDAPGDVQYTQQQLQSLWIQAGGNQQAAITASAIAMAESGGHSTATCVDTNGSTDRGLWQINSVHGAQSSYDVMTNARAAVAISNNGSNFGAWTTYTSGAYKQFTSGVGPPDNTSPKNATQAAQNQTVAQEVSLFCNPLTQLAAPEFCAVDPFIGGIEQKAVDYAIRQVLGLVLNPIINYMGGVIGVVSGGALIIAGAYILVSRSMGGASITRSQGQSVTDTVSASQEQQRSGAGMFAWMAGPEAGAAATASTRLPAVTGGIGRGQPRVSAFAAQTTSERAAAQQRASRTVRTNEQLRVTAGQYRGRGRRR